MTLTSIAAALALTLGLLAAPGDDTPPPEPTVAGRATAGESDYPRGARPRIPFRRALDVSPRTGAGTWRLLRPGGVSQAMPRRAWAEFAVSRRTVVGSSPAGRGAPARIDVVGPRHLPPQAAATTRLATTPDRSIVGWLRDDGRLATLGHDGLVVLPRVPRAVSAGALLGSGSCREEAPEGGGCLGYVDRTRPRGVVGTTSHGLVQRFPGLRSATDATTDGRVSGVLADAPRCHGVVDAEGREQWRTCFGHRLTGFSPSGRRTLAVLREGGRVVDVMIHGREGRPTTIYDFASSPGIAITQLVWESERSLLAVARSGATWRVLRLPVGRIRPTIRTAAGPLRTGRGEAPYQLPVR